MILGRPTDPNSLSLKIQLHRPLITQKTGSDRLIT